MKLRRAIPLCLIGLCSFARADPQDYFAIRIVDADTGKGVPLVELKTTFDARYFTDSAGYVAFHEPGLMTGDEVWFDVRSFGYESPQGVFGVQGIAFKPIAGKTVELQLKRIQIAERLYRLTGYGLYRDSVLLGKTPPINQPLLNAQVTGQDTVQTAIYKGRYYWFWQDTSRLGFGLGSFVGTGATSPMPDQLDPDVGIDFTYFVDKPGTFAMGVNHVPREGTNPIWADGVLVVKDDKHNERMLSRYVAVDSKMNAVEAGLLLYNDASRRFELLTRFPGNGDATLALSGRPFVGIEDGIRYAYSPNFVRVRADFASASDPSQYDGFTCFTDHGRGADIQRRDDGSVDWRWERGAPLPKQERLDQLVKEGILRRDDLPIAFRDAATGKPIELANGSIAWSPYLKKWTYVFHEKHGDSLLGEVWFATANAPQGPWRGAVKIATHAMKDNNNDLYNVIQHDELTRDDGRFVYFEGTFVNTFGGPRIPVPYYNYNQLMYRIDLADKRLHLPPPAKGWTSVNPARE